jgi:hypothetical protein
MGSRPAPVYFTDENTLGLGKLLRRSGRSDVLYPGHEDLPEVPVGTPDLDWMPVIAQRRLIVVTRDRRIRSRPADLLAYWELGIRSVWIGAKQDLGPHDQVALFLTHEHRLQREIIKRGPGPWALAMSASGLRPLRLRTNG